MQSHTARVQDIPMRWEESGSGDPVILVHGIPTCPALWRHVAPLIQKRRVLAWERVGYGSSIPEGRDRDISVAAQAGYLAAWMEDQGIARAVFQMRARHAKRAHAGPFSRSVCFGQATGRRLSSRGRRPVRHAP